MEKKAELLQKLKNSNLNLNLIKEILEWHKPIADKFISQYNEYKAKDLSIQHRTFKDDKKINRKVNNDFEGEIVDQAVGYVFGKPISYELEKNNYSDINSGELKESNKYQSHYKVLHEFLIRNMIDDLDAETVKRQAIHGLTYRLCYIDEDGNTRLMNLPPEEIIIFEDGTGEPEYAIRYYETVDGLAEKVIQIELYDKVNIYEYELKNSLLTPIQELKHMFNLVPIISFKNNNEQLGDFEKVANLIDQYDRLLSDGSNELEEFRLAYMVFTGAEIDKETVEAARASGAFSLPDEKSDAKFLVKQIDVNFLDFMESKLSENIYKFSKTVNMSDENFSGGNESGESRKWKLLGLEQKAIIKERKFKRGLRQMFKVICSSWNIKNIDINYLDINYTFSRTIPVDLKYIGESINALAPHISQQIIIKIIAIC